MNNKIEIKSGDQYGRLTLTGHFYSKKQRRVVEAVCDCGNKKDYLLSNLTRGNTTSCGCAQREIAAKVNYKHGKTTRGDGNHPLYCVYATMKDRCYNSMNKSYANYGGRGIAVCDRWLESFDNFLEDVGDKPSPNHSLDRYPDNNGNYGPGNIRWATPQMQGRNKRNNLLITAFGEIKCLTDWVEDKRCQIGMNGLWVRIKGGWEAEKAIVTPSLNKKAA